jgi:hypothetical protein
MLLKDEEWNIAIDPVDNANVIEELIKIKGGYAISHLLCIKRADGSTFTSTQLADLQTMLYYLFTFVEGRVANVVLPVGLDAGQNVCWQSWAPWRTQSWKNVMTWVDPHHGEAIAAAFPGFAKQWKDPSWQEAIRIAVQGYAHANRNDADLETGIILAVMSLDTLAWQKLVLRDRMLTEEGFKRLTTSDHIRLLCIVSKIPLSFHARTPELQRIAKLQPWVDVAQAVVEVRNNVVHPDNKLKKKAISMHDAVTEAWICGLWMCELVILYSIGYSGPYSDRRTFPKHVGVLDKLPWDSATEKT